MRPAGDCRHALRISEGNIESIAQRFNIAVENVETLKIIKIVLVWNEPK